MSAGLNRKWDRRFIELAAHVATWSKDPSTKVGCVVVNSERRVLAMGYNGFPSGVLDSAERYANRPMKYRMVVHSELNAICNASQQGVSLKGAVMYLPFPPCNECMKGIIQAGIARVVWPARNKIEDDMALRKLDPGAPIQGSGSWASSIVDALVMAREAGVVIDRVRMEDPT